MSVPLMAVTVAPGRASLTAFTTVAERPITNTWSGSRRCSSVLVPFSKPVAGVSSTGPPQAVAKGAPHRASGKVSPGATTTPEPSGRAAGKAA